MQCHLLYFRIFTRTVKRKTRCASQGRHVNQVSYLCEIMSISSPHQAMARTTAKNIAMSQDKRACSGRRKTLER